MDGELKKRLKKIKGQLEGVERMLAQNRSCEEIFQQLQAVRSATREVMLILIEDEICRTISPKKKKLLLEKIKLLFKIKQ